MGRLLQIGFVWLGCAIAWVILGTTLVERSGESSGALREEVHALWGPPLELRPPQGGYVVLVPRHQTTTTKDAAGRETQTDVVHEEAEPHQIALVGSDVRARLRLTQRQKGLLWFPTYEVELTARYRFQNDSGQMRRIDFTLPLPGERAIFDDFSVLDDEGNPIEAKVQGGAASFALLMKEGEERGLHVALRSRGTSQFAYALTGGSGEVRDFRMVIESDFADVDFPAGSLSPTQHGRTASGWRGEWKFTRLIAGMNIAVELPQRINPGPLASRITFFAPVGLLFFFFVVAVRAAAQRRPIHPLNYFFFGCAFFAFHLLFAYLVDHVAIAPALALSSVVSIFLVVTYARLFVGWRFALVEMGIAQVLYLVLFSTTFLWKGYTGLSITVGAILTLFVMMQVTGRATATIAASKDDIVGA
jgi:inner membrane protein involved in colicin E2 resistance